MPPKQTRKTSARLKKSVPPAPEVVEEVEEDENALLDRVDYESGQSVYFGYDKQRDYLDQLVGILLRQNKANSVIICGEPGSGKNYLVDAVFSQYPVLRVPPHPDEEFGHLNVVQFKFDGNLHGKNDLSTLRIIGRRLNTMLDKALQVNVEEEEGAKEEDGEGELDESEMSSKVANSIPKIIAQFNFLIKNSANFRCIILLDNFEVFSYRQQYLLYNLFDLIQQGQSVLIIGLTRRVDYIQLLTSRVQSRLNRRMIHLMGALPTLERYTRFCESYSKALGLKTLTLPRSEMERAFKLSQNFAEAKRFVQQYSFPVPPKAQEDSDGRKAQVSSSYVTLNCDPKVIELLNCTRNELLLLIVASKQLRNLDEEVFTCQRLHEWSSRVSHLKALTFQHVIKCIYKLLELDLLIVAKETRSQSNKTGQLFISPYTSLMLNISDFQLKETMTRMDKNCPEYMKQLLK
ncbi:origin recognition complex subunit 4 [Tyrophagus putrescentiae]|nr:origin recognition complex subunit 4 [Tyrophagus putrescentiae]